MVRDDTGVPLFGAEAARKSHIRGDVIRNDIGHGERPEFILQEIYGECWMAIPIRCLVLWNTQTLPQMTPTPI